MKKTLLASLFSLTLIVSTQSNAAMNDICTQMPGHWEGTLTLKNPEDCKQLGGCTHPVTGEVKHVEGSDYALLLSSPLGQNEATLLCENGQVTNIPGVTLTCNNNNCVVRYDGPMMTAELNKR